MAGYLYAIGQLEPHPVIAGGYVGWINKSGSTGVEPQEGAMRVELHPVRNNAGEHSLVVNEVRDTIETASE